MTEIISFGTAMLAVEQGKTVQYRLEYAGIWINFIGDQPAKNYMGDNITWRIKPEPVKYSVDVWLDRDPVSQPKELGLHCVLIGVNTCFNIVQSYQFNKHYKITVEECKE